jgi:hypothetical protein
MGQKEREAMKTTHKIAIQNDHHMPGDNSKVRSVRVSDSRRYEACLVATSTPETVESFKQRPPRFTNDVREVEVGEQCVVSWHGDEHAARKALGGHQAKWYLSRCYKIEVRTDIEIKEQP